VIRDAFAHKPFGSEWSTGFSRWVSPKNRRLKPVLHSRLHVQTDQWSVRARKNAPRSGDQIYAQAVRPGFKFAIID
jgi:hypothetical protein